jgi:hypothetical protein
LEKTGPIFNERNFDINSLLSEFKKRRFLFIGFAVIALSLAFALTKYLPRKYNSFHSAENGWITRIMIRTPVQNGVFG